MQPDPCNCLLCQVPIDESSWDARDRRIAAHIREHGWTVMGVSGDERTAGWSYSIGLWHTLRSPEISVFGLRSDVAHRLLNVLGDRIRDGAVLRPGRRSDVLEGFDVEVRLAQPTWYWTFFGAALDFYQLPPLPVVQLCWPDRDGRFAWEASFDVGLQPLQPMLWLSRDEHPRGAWADEDPHEGWPFRGSLPYTKVQASTGVAAGSTRIVAVVRDQDGSWAFLDETAEATAVIQLCQVADEHPYVLDVADLVVGTRADVDAAGIWARSPLT